MERLIVDGARFAFLRRLTCMATPKERNLRFYDLVGNREAAVGLKVSLTLFHMTKTCLDTFEREWSEVFNVLEWLP